MTRRLRGLIAPAALFLLVLSSLSCSERSTDVPDPDPRPAVGSILLSLGSSTGSVVGAGVATTAITITRSGAQQGVVTFGVAAVPPGVVASFSPPTLAPEATTSTLTFTVSSTSPRASYPMIVNATAPGMSTSSVGYTLELTASAASPAQRER